MQDVEEPHFNPWPLQLIHDRLMADDVLWQLCQPRTRDRAFDTRELGLEALVRDVLTESAPVSIVTIRRRIGSTLRLRNAPFPANAQPDVVLHHDGRFHVCEVKSGRADYGRFDCVFESKPFQQFLAETGHIGADPWEVEQDLIKLRLFPRLSDEIGSCLFLMVDAYAGTGRSWTRVFRDSALFKETMRTKLIQDLSDELLARSIIVPLRGDRLAANLIACAVTPAFGKGEPVGAGIAT